MVVGKWFSISRAQIPRRDHRRVEARCAVASQRESARCGPELHAGSLARNVASEALEPYGSLKNRPEAQRPAGQPRKLAQCVAETSHHRDSMAREPAIGSNGGELPDRFEVELIVVVGLAHGAGEFTAMTDHEVSDERSAQPFNDKTERTGGVPRHRNCAYTGQHFRFSFETCLDEHVARM